MAYRTNQLGIITDNQFQYMMPQISKNGWCTKEPGDTPYSLNENIFQGAIDLLVEEKILKPVSLMRLLKQNKITLYHEDLEEILHLRKGTLFAEEDYQKIIQLKQPNNKQEV